MKQPRDIDLLPTDIADDLRATVRELLADRCDPTRVVACYDGDRSVVAPLWQALATDLGLAGLLVAEAHGGHGASAREAAVVLEELGAAAAPVPFLTSSVIAATLLGTVADSVPEAAELLGRLASGEVTAALLVPFSTGPDGELSGVGTGLTGTVTSVAGAVEADVLLVPVSSERGLEVHVVDTVDPGVTVTAVESLDMTRQLADVSLAGGAGSLVVPAVAGEDAVRQALRAGAALMASDQSGVARWCLTATVEYLRERRQFGRVVGGFQAIKHRLADVFVDTEGASAAAGWAAATLAEVDDPDEVALATAVAASWCSDVAVQAAEEAVQLHGGIGMTWEHPAHLYLKRAKADQLALGSPEAHRLAVARLADIPAPTTEVTR